MQANLCVPFRDVPHEVFRTAHPPKIWGRVDFGNTRDVVGRPCNGADGCALAVYVINPYLSVFNQLFCLSSSLIQGHGEENLKLEFKL